jgi:predicted nucleotide-binding protein
MKHRLFEQLQALRTAIGDNQRRNVNTHWSVGETLNSIRELLLEELSESERGTFEKLVKPIKIDKKHPYTVQTQEGWILCSQLLSYAKQESKDRPTNDTAIDGTPVARVVPHTKNIFIIHGHDEANVLRLRALLKERYELNPIILREQAGRGRSVIEKFEEEAASAGFAIALLTPDDIIRGDPQSYAQARPNVIFELGWFYGRLGRGRVCILFRKGTVIHSDLHGILRLEFERSIEETVLELERELTAVGLISKRSPD